MKTIVIIITEAAVRGMIQIMMLMEKLFLMTKKAVKTMTTT